MPNWGLKTLILPRCTGCFGGGDSIVPRMFLRRVILSRDFMLIRDENTLWKNAMFFIDILLSRSKSMLHATIDWDTNKPQARIYVEFCKFYNFHAYNRPRAPPESPRVHHSTMVSRGLREGPHYAERCKYLDSQCEASQPGRNGTVMFFCL